MLEVLTQADEMPLINVSIDISKAPICVLSVLTSLMWEQD